MLERSAELDLTRVWVEKHTTKRLQCVTTGGKLLST